MMFFGKFPRIFLNVGGVGSCELAQVDRVVRLGESVMAFVRSFRRCAEKALV